jgi:hypothetical protein
MAQPAQSTHELYNLDIEGGFFYNLCLRLRLVRPQLGHKRIVLAGVIIAWVPLFLLSLWADRALHGKIPFLYDVEVHTRCVVALAIFLASEHLILRILSETIGEFLKNEIVEHRALPDFERATRTLSKLYGSNFIEIGLLILIVVSSYLFGQEDLGLGTSTWFRHAEEAGGRLTLAGYWFAFVSLPFTRFIQLRWYLRLGFWFWFLWRISRMNLRLTPTHPDRAGGIGFVGLSIHAFAPLSFAQGAMTSGWIANYVLYRGLSPLAFQVQIIGTVVVLLILILGPLVMFSRQLVRARWKGLLDYGLLANRYVREFDQKWNSGAAPPGEALIGSSDIQSLADMGNSFAILERMRFVPFGWQEMILIIVLAIVPMLPLVLFIVPLDTILEQLLKALL